LDAIISTVSGRRQGPEDGIVVEQAWPKKGRAYTLIRYRHEIVSAALVDL